MPDLAEIRKAETGSQVKAAEQLQREYEKQHAKKLGLSYAIKRLSLIESGAATATELEIAALASVYKRDVEEIRQAAAASGPDVSDETGEHFFEELKGTPASDDVLICSVYGGSRSTSNDEEDEYGRLLIELLQAPHENIKLAMYLPYPERIYFSTRGENRDSVRLLEAYDVARTYAHDRFKAIRDRVPKGSIALYEPYVEPFLSSGQQVLPIMAPFNVRQMLVVTTTKVGERVPLRKRLFAWTHDDRPSGGTIPQDIDRDSTLRQQMLAAWTAWMGEPLACWEQVGRLGDAPAVLDSIGAHKRGKHKDFRSITKDEQWGWKKTSMSRTISEMRTKAEREAGSATRRELPFEESLPLEAAPTEA